MSLIFSLKLFVALMATVLCIPAYLTAEQEAPVLVETKGLKDPSLDVGEKLYQHYCIMCHGDKGNGEGFNAEYLDPKPADHTNAENMSKRTDEKIFDTISDGGKSVGKSTYMPPWGGIFGEAQIESLILYLRELCQCQAVE